MNVIFPISSPPSLARTAMLVIVAADKATIDVLPCTVYFCPLVNALPFTVRLGVAYPVFAVAVIVNLSSTKISSPLVIVLPALLTDTVAFVAVTLNV